MSIILNQKEDVLKFELTKHGRKLLGIGSFQPSYFSFFDDSIIYDYSYLGETEDINNIQDRILDQSLTFGIVNTLEDKLNNSLGKSDQINDNAPAWDIQVLNGQISYSDTNSTYEKKIFNLSKNITYTIKLDDKKEPVITDDYLLFDLKELNISDDIQNFEIELVTFDELSGGKNTGLERKLFFESVKTNIINDIIYDSDELPNIYFETKITTSDVKYYLDILVDDEIDQAFIVEKQKVLQQKIQTLYQTINDCPEDPCEPC